MKRLYGFGDSLIAGHALHYGMLDDFCAQHHVALTNFAQNGATMLPTRPTDDTYASRNHLADVAAQVAKAPMQAPDWLVFDGLTNDGANYVPQLRDLGAISTDYQAPPADTYCGAFEHAVAVMRRKYPQTPLFFVAVHHMPCIPLALQDQMQALARQICAKWAVPVIDVYRRGQLNTCLPQMAATWSYDHAEQPHDGDGTHLIPAGYQRFYTPLIEAALLALDK